MLRHLASGPRQFGRRPMYVHRRANWEFFAVLKGSCRAVVPDSGDQPLCTACLWIFPPETAHGWSDRPDGVCDVAVFHFATVHHLLAKAATKEGFLQLPLSASERARVGRLVRELGPHVERMTAKSLLVFERAKLDLSLLALDRLPAGQEEFKSSFALRKVQAAIEWYGAHIADRPKLEETARAVGVSVRHLRRLFRETRGESPQAAFTRQRVLHAMALLAQSDRKMESVIPACGFRSASDFCRVFARCQGISPHAWRRQLMKGGSR